MDKTLIFFVSDNGAISQPFTRNYPLRGGKSNTLEGGIRVPFAVQWNGHVPANKIHNDMIWSLDIFPTATTAAGVPLPTDRAYDGLDVMPYLSGPGS